MHFLQPNTSEPIMTHTKHCHAPGTVFTPCISNNWLSGIDAGVDAIGNTHEVNQHQSFTSDFCLVIKIIKIRFHESDRQNYLRPTSMTQPRL